MHDIGNFTGRLGHPQAGAILAQQMLVQAGMDHEEVADICTAIGNPEELELTPTLDIWAALVLADKSDVHRSRVRNQNPATFDIHDRVNFASQHSFVRVDAEHHLIVLELTIDVEKAALLDYFEIFLGRMLFIRKAAHFLACEFHLVINKNRML